MGGGRIDGDGVRRVHRVHADGDEEDAEDDAHTLLDDAYAYHASTSNDVHPAAVSHHYVFDALFAGRWAREEWAEHPRRAYRADWLLEPTSPLVAVSPYTYRRPLEKSRIPSFPFKSFLFFRPSALSKVKARGGCVEKTSLGSSGRKGRTQKV